MIRNLFVMLILILMAHQQKLNAQRYYDVGLPMVAF